MAPWSEFDLGKAEWVIPAIRMKMARSHIVPLSQQASELLKEWRERQLKEAKAHHLPAPIYVLPNQQSRKYPYMSENTMLKILSLLGYKGVTTIHGLRHLGSTILNESRLFSKDAIERQLAHVDGNSIRGTYNHAEYLDERRKMMQWWADHLDSERLRPFSSQ